MDDEQDKLDLLKRLKAAMKPFADEVNEAEDLALFVLGVRGEPEQADGLVTVYTIGNIVGDLNILADGLYTELQGQLEGGDASVFSRFRDVIFMLQEEFDVPWDAGDDSFAGETTESAAGEEPEDVAEPVPTNRTLH